MASPHRPAQPGQEGRGADQQQVGHRGAGQQAGGERGGGQLRTARPVPQPDDGGGGEHGDGGSEHGGVVGMKEIQREAEDQCVHDGPHRPHHVCPSGHLAAPGPANTAQSQQCADHRQRRQPGDLATGGRHEQAQHAGPVVARRARAAQTGDAVVGEDQAQPRVIRGVAHPRPRRRGYQHHHPDPQRADQGPRSSPGGELGHTAASGSRPARRVGERQRGNHQVGLKHLRVEGQPDQRTTQQQPARLSRLERPDGRPGRTHQQQHEQRLGVIEAAHDHHHRRQREHQRGHQRHPPPAAPASEPRWRTGRARWPGRTARRAAAG